MNEKSEEMSRVSSLDDIVKTFVYPNKSNGPSHSYQFDESTFIFRVIKSNFLNLFHFSMNFM